jgi:hypothetical protein
MRHFGALTGCCQRGFGEAINNRAHSCHGIMNFSSSHGRVPHCGMLINRNFEDKDVILAENVGVFVEKRPCHCQAFSLHPLSLPHRPKPIRYSPACLACKEGVNLLSQTGDSSERFTG